MTSSSPQKKNVLIISLDRLIFFHLSLHFLIIFSYTVWAICASLPWIDIRNRKYLLANIRLLETHPWVYYCYWFNSFHSIVSFTSPILKRHRKYSLRFLGRDIQVFLGTKTSVKGFSHYHLLLSWKLSFLYLQSFIILYTFLYFYISLFLLFSDWYFSSPMYVG